MHHFPPCTTTVTKTLAPLAGADFWLTAIELIVGRAAGWAWELASALPA
ncbi:MAG TPA: hypothetical protein VH538_13110 [Gaiellaceae bacterium]